MSAAAKLLGKQKQKGIWYIKSRQSNIICSQEDIAQDTRGTKQNKGNENTVLFISDVL